MVDSMTEEKIDMLIKVGPPQFRCTCCGHNWVKIDTGNCGNYSTNAEVETGIERVEYSMVIRQSRQCLDSLKEIDEAIKEGN
jgi:hypothetical protein